MDDEGETVEEASGGSATNNQAGVTVARPPSQAAFADI